MHLLLCTVKAGTIMEEMDKAIDRILADFTWDDLGNVEEGRHNLGPYVKVTTYRLMQFSIRKILEQMYGLEKAEEVFRLSGMLAGRRFAEQHLNKSLPFPEFVAQLKQTLQDERIGVLQVEKLDLDTLTMVFTVAEDLDCSGLPIYGIEVCDFDEGFIAGILQFYTGKTFNVKEVDCWANGDKACRFNIHAHTV